MTHILNMGDVIEVTIENPDATTKLVGQVIKLTPEILISIVNMNIAFPVFPILDKIRVLTPEQSMLYILENN